MAKPKKLASWAEHTLARLAKNEAVEAATILDAFGATFAGLAPFVLHLEDSHEADQERTSFIQELAKAVLRSKGVGLVVTSRKETAEPFTPIKLAPLSRQEVETLLGRELKSTLPNEALEFIYNKAAGNPLYTLEYLRYLTRQGFLWNDGKSWHWRKPEHSAMPATIEALIEGLIHRAGAEPLHKYVLESKALLPLQASNELWWKTARVNEAELQTATTELSLQGLFRDRDFAHPLFREVTLKTLTSERKQHLARRAINALESEPAQAAIFIEDARLEPEKTLSLLKHAAAQTKEHNEIEAAKFLAKAAPYASGEEKSKLALEAATALQYHDIPAALALVERLLREEPDNIEALYLGTLFYAREARQIKAEQFFALLPRHERDSTRGIETLLEMKFLLNKYHDFLALWEQYQHLQTTLDITVIRRAVYIIAGQSNVDEAITLALATLERPDLTEKQRVSLLNPLAIAYSLANQHAQAEAIYDELVAMPSHLLAGKGLRIILHNRAWTRKVSGRYLEARQDALENYRLASEVGDGFSVGKALTLLGELALELGDYEQAESYLSDSLTLVRQRDLNLFVVDAEGATSLLYQAWSAPHSGILALRHARAALEVARKVEYTPSLMEALFCASFAETTYGSAAKALELADELALLAQGNSIPLGLYYGAWAKAKVLGLLGQSDEATSLLQQAYTIAEQINHEVNKHKIGLELDRLNKNVASARTRMHWFEERGLLNGVNIANRYFPELANTKETPKQPVSTVRLEVLGSLQARGDKLTPIRGRKRQELLALLLEARLSGRSEVSRLTLLDTLYSNEDELKATASLKSVVHTLRDSLGENAITTTNNGYALGECSSDAELFLQTGDITL